MKQFICLIAVIGTLSSNTLAAPWVVLDSRSDMLAMSSEVSDDAVAYALPPAGMKFSRKYDDDTVTPINSPEPVSENDDAAPIPMTTEEQSQLEQTTPSVLKLARSELSDSETQEVLQQDDVMETTVTPVTENGVQLQDVPEVTTMVPTVSSSPSSAEAMEEDIQSKDMNIQVVPDTDEPTVPQRQNPNVIAEEESLTAVVVNKKKHGIFTGKKSKFPL